ncbi:MAG: hypothetical protein MK052_04150 [Alphaproteobacteria bacterium]|nr:hypothetical protein [Alphaproteobacteria bacterium]
MQTHLHATQQFYEGMAQATLDAKSKALPLLVKQFDIRGQKLKAEQAFNKNILFDKRLHQIHNGLPGAPISHALSRFSLEYFCSMSAINLYRLTPLIEQFKAELITEAYYEYCETQEIEWLGVYNADIPNFKRDTGHALGQLRCDIIKLYLTELNAKSSRDSDIFIITRRFLERQQLAKSSGVDVTPAMHEECAKTLEVNAGWLKRYLSFHPL